MYTPSDGDSRFPSTKNVGDHGASVLYTIKNLKVPYAKYPVDSFIP